MPNIAITVEGKIADIPAHLMEAMRQETMNAFERAEPVGEEIAALLFGRRTEMGWSVVAWRPLPREDGARPAVPLTESEEEAAGEILWDYKADRELAGMEPIGWIRSRTRGMAALSPEDAQVCRRFFGEHGSLAVILRPSTQRPMTAAFFYVAADASRQFSRRGVELSIAPDEEALEEEHERRREAEKPPEPPAIPAAVVDDRPMFGEFHEPPPAKRSWWKPALGALAGALTTAVACLYFLDRPLRFDGEIRRSQVVLTWNREAGFMTGATGGEVNISGAARELTLPELRTGTISIDAPPGDFKVMFRLRGPYARSQRSVLTVVRPPGYKAAAE